MNFSTLLTLLLASTSAAAPIIDFEPDTDLHVVDLENRAAQPPVTTTWHGEVYTITGPTTLVWERPATTYPAQTIATEWVKTIPFVTSIPGKVVTWYSVATISDASPTPTA